MSDRNTDRNPTREITGLADAIAFLEDDDIPLPADGLTLEKIRRNGYGFTIQDDGFSFKLERHPSPMFSSTSMTGRRRATPARWHITTRYYYDLTTDEWRISELDREFRFDPYRLIQAEFDSVDSMEVWTEKIEQVQAAANPEEELETEFAPIEEVYHDRFHEVPEEKVEAMLSVLKKEFRSRVDLD